MAQVGRPWGGPTFGAGPAGERQPQPPPQPKSSGAATGNGGTKSKLSELVAWAEQSAKHLGAEHPLVEEAKAKVQQERDALLAAQGPSAWINKASQDLQRKAGQVAKHSKESERLGIEIEKLQKQKGKEDELVAKLTDDISKLRAELASSPQASGQEEMAKSAQSWAAAQTGDSPFAAVAAAIGQLSAQQVGELFTGVAGPLLGAPAVAPPPAGPPAPLQGGASLGSPAVAAAIAVPGADADDDLFRDMDFEDENLVAGLEGVMQAVKDAKANKGSAESRREVTEKSRKLGIVFSKVKPRRCP